MNFILNTKSFFAYEIHCDIINDTSNAAGFSPHLFRVCAMRTEAFNIFFCDIFAVRLKIDGADLK